MMVVRALYSTRTLPTPGLERPPQHGRLCRRELGLDVGGNVGPGSEDLTHELADVVLHVRAHPHPTSPMSDLARVSHRLGAC